MTDEILKKAKEAGFDQEKVAEALRKAKEAGEELGAMAKAIMDKMRSNVASIKDSKLRKSAEDALKK